MFVGVRKYDALRLPADMPNDGQHRSLGTVAVLDAPRATDDVPLPAPAVAAATAGYPENVPLLPGPQTAGRRLAFLAVNGCTVASLLLGMTAIFLAIAGHLAAAPLCLVACVIFDGLDGGLARAFGVSTPFGAQMDSMADMCSFGIATPIVVYQWLSHDAPHWALAPVCALVAICAGIRLARFNVSPKNGHYFSGIPTTIVAATLALACLLRPHHGIALVAGVAVLGILMVTTFPYAKLAQLRRLPLWLLVVPAAGLILDVTVTFLALVGIYLASGPLLWLKHRRG